MSQQAVINDIPLKTVLGIIRVILSSSEKWVVSKGTLLPSRSSSFVQDPMNRVEAIRRMPIFLMIVDFRCDELVLFFNT